MDKGRHYQKLEKFSLLNSHYVFLDTEDYMADGLFIKHEVTVHFGQEYGHQDWPYLLILCRVRKKDESRFLAALEELPNKMLLCGQIHYMDKCREIWTRLENSRNEEGEVQCAATSTAE